MNFVENYIQYFNFGELEIDRKKSNHKKEKNIIFEL